jgi:hypothetical protein
MQKCRLAAGAVVTLSACSGADPSTLPNSPLSYEQVESVVGCQSKFSGEKKQDIFDAQYKNKWYRWNGTVLTSNPDSVELDMNGGGTQELSLDFDSDGAGYSLMEGQEITVRFVLDSLGGCFLPYGGKHGMRVVDPAPTPAAR